MSSSKSKPDIDPTSFMLGMINCFIEMVACGVKRLALSPPLSPDDYELVSAASKEIADRSGVRWHLEKSLMVTDLQTPEFTRGKWSILYFKDEQTLQDYQSLKRRQSDLKAKGLYTADERQEISREFMRLLSYPEAVIEEKLAKKGEEDPYIHVTSESS